MQRLTQHLEVFWFPGPVHSALVAPVGLVALYLVSFPYRTDYAAHALAGAATVVVVSGVVGLLGRSGPAVGLVGVPLVALGGLVAELTIVGPDIDGLDVATGVIGGVVVAAALLEPRSTREQSSALVALGCAFGILALGLRFGSVSVG